MKRYNYTLSIIHYKFCIICGLALFVTMGANAQNPYSNYTMTNTTDVIGTSRYVGMGGAMGALGADISVISNNPAGIGLYRRNDFSVTMGGQFQVENPMSGDNRGHFSFDQIGIVAAFPSEFTESSWAFGANFQKKADYGFSQYCEYDGLNGLSQAAQLHALFNPIKPNYAEESLLFRANDAYIYDMADGKGGILGVKADNNSFYRHTSGNLYGLDLNLSGTSNQRVFFGVTMGLDFVQYRSNLSYVEQRYDQDNNIQDYEIASNQKVNGVGLNFKVGTIFRPFEDNPFRIGLTIETPTWYRLKQEGSYYTIYSKNEYKGKSGGYDVYNYLPADGDYCNYDSPDDNFLEYNVFAPWKFRASIGSTVDKIFAWDVEYEYAMYNYTKMGYPSAYDEDGASINMDKDRAMSELTDKVMNGVHNFRAGIEVKPVPELALRAGYNYYSRPMKKDGRLDIGIDSYSTDFVLGTDYMNLNEAHIFTVGLGYRYKQMYFDFAYKYRNQTGDFYAFDDQFQAGGKSDLQFMMSSPSYLKPTEVCLDRHNFTFTFGCKF